MESREKQEGARYSIAATYKNVWTLTRCAQRAFRNRRIASFNEAAYKGPLGHIWVPKTHVCIVRKRQLCVLESMNAKNLRQCSQDQKAGTMFLSEVNSTMAPRNSMRTTTWSFVKTTFPVKIGQNGRGTKACFQSQR